MSRKVYSNKKTKPEKIETDKVKDIIGMVVYFLIVVAVMVFVVKFIGQRTVVIGDSMQTTLSDGDNLITDKITYRFRDPKRFDIVVFPFKENTSKLLIKRIIGMPGETVQIKNGKVYINGYELQENYGIAVMNDAGLASEPILLGEDEYFVLGDNRNNSQDSRFSSVGNVSRSDLIGRAWVRLWPLDKICLLKHQ
ncbi:signal peptidase I [Frisingicoccus sp.]|uniref:signal peptidase I n=1 Tax=Frisingicoccus sp. TaxID=1918627 RepID=UPI0025BF3FCA|nr:signal peptidase I [Frisingicoccus sp.]MDD6232614.1 signal peptidase I [Frisingicoccus sp.]MDY4835352.1 signal peptidase I [Frisingicoccus sp.]MDY4922816.1 signal peptidase I [Frisingicoccus sp.]MDY5956933.1 signal peptidase I [Frisingicoccus sp.]